MRKYRAGATLAQVAADTGMSVSAVYERLKAWGEPFRPRSYRPGQGITTSDLVSRYRGGESIAAIAASVRMDNKTIRRRLVEAGVRIRPPGHRVRRPMAPVEPKSVESVETPGERAEVSGEELAGLYRAGWGLDALGVEFGMPAHRVRALLLAAGVELRGRGRPRRDVVAARPGLPVVSGLRVLGSSGPEEREVWRVMADEVIARIRSGELAEGARIPSQAELMLAFAEPNREHARRAVQVLCSWRWAVALGPRTFVVSPASKWPSRGEGRAARIHRGGPEPVYRQIADILAEEIADGEIKPGAMAPSQIELRREFGVSHMSARKARQELHDRGLVYTVGGASRFVGSEGTPLRGEGEEAADSGDGLGGANRIRRDGPVPMYRQIAVIIADQIARGELGAGEMVPSEKDLRREFGIAQMTARNVHRELRDRGLAHTLSGAGTFVGPKGTPRPDSLLPMFQVIVNELVAEIRAGKIGPEDPIPSENVLVLDKGASKATVRRAVAMLREDGWVFTVPQRGTFVAHPDQWPKLP
ncbi:hypothetical protein GCM10009556_035090 [Acrocarpospora pleiomorpha]|uniref:GntR family transcriptional regulator n=1 Tax=Acrocarpospora pleiomorpha TaxID=90975 RepID=UPI0012D32AA5|nr:GntR family transcriptional regulator [Acrocarpospora pleiomorpha]